MARAVATPVSARARLVAAFVLAFGFAAVQTLDTLLALGAIAAVAVLAAGLSWRELARLRGAVVLACGFMVVLPMIAGETVFARIGPLTLYLEGAQAGALIAARLLAIVALTLALLSPVPVLQLVAAMRALGVPALMADLALLTLRYMDEVAAQLARARLARRLRGGRSGWRALPEHALLLATSLIRAQARSEQLWAAMRLRGYSSGLAAPAPPLLARDWGFMAGALVLALFVLWLDRL
ncbi:cobalt/nickel transport system permease protein [Roseinatronobacter thiooxidans]|uniref:Cobalt/nickel transport system permease protein n=1 Tax=Roseinatronobacter thiooxidans TaxID=121821 RepID=A0A2W7S5B4_9RHOB|nr:energy-coupling factor transporter transmembrane component T [Roseinatronobacter thiooxidans]PZX45672.1 cobalt/nickel transport system permease protein [Roseinatronobacter thiooxidans]